MTPRSRLDHRADSEAARRPDLVPAPTPSPALARWCVWACSTRAMLAPFPAGPGLCVRLPRGHMRPGIGGEAGWHRGPEERQGVSAWACSAAAVLFLRTNPAGQKSLARLEQKQGQGQALTVLAQKLARAVSSRLQREVGFERTLVLQQCREGSRRAGRPTGARGASLATVLCHTAPRASTHAHEHRGPVPCPGACDWTLARAPGQRAQVPHGACGLPLPAPGAHWRLERGRLACA